MVGGSEVNGDWIEDRRQPIVEWSADGAAVTVKVTGWARQKSSSYIDLQAHVLRNGTDERFEDTNFRDQDEIYLSFRTPINGYVAVYFADADGRVYRLLPFSNQELSCQSVIADTPYVFFDPSRVQPQDRPFASFKVTCAGGFELNRLYLLFSPTPFVKPTETLAPDTDIPSLTFGHFQKWLSQTMKRNEALQRIVFPVNISPKE